MKKFISCLKAGANFESKWFLESDKKQDFPQQRFLGDFHIHVMRSLQGFLYSPLMLTSDEVSQQVRLVMEILDETLLKTFPQFLMDTSLVLKDD